MAVGWKSGLSPAESRELDAIRGADSLAALASLLDARSERRGYLTAKRRWRQLRAKEPSTPTDASLPGDQFEVGATTFLVHGITHADTDEERETLRSRVEEWLADGETIYCEQGIRSMYFQDIPEVYAMDDYRWATRQSDDRGLSTDGTTVAAGAFDGISTDLTSVATQARKLSFLFAESVGEVYGHAVGAAIGRTASTLLGSDEQRAVVDDFASFCKSRQAATDTSKLADLQQYYKQTFLPQPLEREWLRRRDPRLELFTHARNERMADYARYHGDGRVRLVVGAAHQPGVGYYLRVHRDGDRDRSAFEPVA